MHKNISDYNLSADYIVVGAGSAGAVIANRLSANPSIRVILIEAGPPSVGIRGAVPAGSLFMMGDPKVDWTYMGEPDPTLNGRSICWSGGKMLGGSSGINGMVYFRGSRADFDHWAREGCTGWSFSEVFPYFLRSENFEGSPSQTHGTSGPLSVAPARSLQQLAAPWRQACDELGMKPLEDYCAGTIDGSFFTLCTQHNGVRSSTARAFLDTAQNRPNLTILTGREVQSIVFEGKRAVGIRTKLAGAMETYGALKEVVICAGAIGSPALLLRSGVGPGDDLNALGIHVVAGLEGVGRNFHDHVSVTLSKEVRSKTYNVGMGPVGVLGSALNYLLFKRGRLTSPPVQAMSYLRSQSSLAEPDISLNFIPLALDLSAAKPKLRKRGGISMATHPAQPKGRGQLRLRSADPAIRPIIDFKLLGDERDVDTLVNGCGVLEKLCSTNALSSYIVGNYDPETTPRSRDEWLAFLRQRAAIGYHPVGSCRMGVDAMAVVGPDLKVHGLEALRVIDASIMPRITSGNTNAPTIMIAEKGAELILSDR